MSIFLIGMPGVGKSTIGVILAKQLGYDFIDADLVIQKREKRLLSRILEENGTEGFLKIEEEVCASLAGAADTVVATGGSACYAADAMEAFRKNGTVVYLEVSLDALKKRLRDLKGRGVVLRDGQTLEDVWKERIPLYEKYADVKVCEDGLSLEETLSAVLTALDQT
jgi:shikimate kinase